MTPSSSIIHCHLAIRLNHFGFFTTCFNLKGGWGFVFGFWFWVLISHNDKEEDRYNGILLAKFKIWILLDGVVVLCSNESQR